MNLDTGSWCNGPMEPALLTGLATVLGRLLKLYETAQGALQTPGAGAEELQFVRELAESIAKLRPRRGVRELGPEERLNACIAAAFLRAYRLHWLEDPRMLRVQRAECERATAVALTRASEAQADESGAEDEVRALGLTLTSPLQTSLYQSLWQEFCCA